MIERVTIYGDSFADPKYEPKSLHPTWYGLLKKEGYDAVSYTHLTLPTKA